MWQDKIITICMIFLNYALIPQIYQGFKERKSFINLQTSIITVISVLIISIAYLTMGLFASSIMGFITLFLWSIFLIQGIIYKKK